MAAKSLGPKSYLLSYLGSPGLLGSMLSQLVLIMRLSFLNPHLLVPLTLLPIAPSAIVRRPSIIYAFPFMGSTCH
jgi:hypothetical protein